MRKKKSAIILLAILFVVACITSYLLVRSTHKDQLNDQFAVGGEISQQSGQTNSLERSSFVYSPLHIDVQNCKEGKDSVGFGLGHTEFLVTGIKSNRCIFEYGTEIENPNWDGKLDMKCKVPTSVNVSLDIKDDGINFEPIRQYCSN